MTLGLGFLRLSPASLWSMTPRELAAAAGRLSPRTERTTRTSLQSLMQRFPDMPRTTS